jgi:hypothetical protein
MVSCGLLAAGADFFVAVVGVASFFFLPKKFILLGLLDQF